MALLHVQFHSDALQQAVGMDVIIPQKVYTQIGMGSSEGEKCKVLYLLHGLSDDQTIWQRRTSIERYVADKNLAVVMPGVQRSWYTDMAYGERFAEFAYREVPAYCQATFRQFSDKREDNFIAGLSMGGYGALKGALLYPERFCACAALSGAFDVERRMRENPGPYMESVFGSIEKLHGSDNDVYALIEKRKNDPHKPAVFMWCGTEDGLYGDTLKAKKLLEEGAYSLLYRESEGNHSWFYWDREIVFAIDWFMRISDEK